MASDPSTIDRPAAAPAPEAAAAAGAAEWRRVEVAVQVGVACVWIGLYALYVRVWIQPQARFGFLQEQAQAVVDGTAPTPFQYRIAVPAAVVWLHDHLGISMATALQAIDLVALALGAVLVERLLRRSGLSAWSLPAALYGAFLGIGCLWWAKFETMTAFAALSLGVLALLGLVRHRELVLAAAVVVLIGTRTDLILALAAAELARWWWVERRPDALRTALALAATGVLATLVLKARYPHNPYVTDLFQLTYNLKPTVLITGIAFLAPVLLPYALLRGSPAMRAALAPHRATLVPLLALVGAELAMSFTIGRVEEVRMFFPLTAALVVLGLRGWLAAASLRPPR